MDSQYGDPRPDPITEAHNLVHVSKQALRTLRWLVVAAFCVRLGWLLLSQPDPISDFASYRSLALGLVDHGQFGYPEPTAKRLPGFPLILAGFALVSRNNIWLGACAVTLSTCLVPMVYAVALRAGATRRIGLIAAGFVAFTPTFVFVSPVLASEHASTLLFLGAICLAFVASEAQKRRSLLLVGVGVLMGLAGLTRGDLWLFLVAPMWIVGRQLRSRGKLLACGLVLAGVGVAAAPWYVRNRVVLGPGIGLSPTAGFNFYAAHNPDGYGFEQAQKRLGNLSILERDRTGWQLGLDYVRETHVVGLAKSVVEGTDKLYFYAPKYAVQYSTARAKKRQGPSLEEREREIARFRAPANSLSQGGYYVLCLWMALACWWWRTVPRRLLELCALVVFVNWVTCTVVFWGKPRYRYVSEVMFCMLAATAVVEATRRVGLLRAKRTAPDAANLENQAEAGLKPESVRPEAGTRATKTN